MATLKRGSTGPDVRKLQEHLQARGFSPGNIDGTFGGGTEAALIAFQKSEGLLADGVAGPKTLIKLGLEPLYDAAIRDTIARFEATGSPVISDGEQKKYHNFWTYCVHGLPNTSPDGFKIPFAAGHVRRMPRLTIAAAAA